MKLLSQQIRDLVEGSSTSSYAIARAAGIDKSAMSRFMNGGRLTMDKLDQLARVLGITVHPDEISLVPRPLEMGRPKQRKEKKMTEQEALHWANYFAEEAAEHNFESRRGVWYIEDLDCLLLYDNNPYANYPDVRPRQMGVLQERFEKVGIKTLACGGSEDEVHEGQSYTVSLLLDCSQDRMDEVMEILYEVVMTIWDLDE